MSRGLTLGIALLGLTCASPERQAPPPDLSVVRDQIDSVWAKYSAAAVGGDANAIAQLYADSAYVVESGLPTIFGNAALRSVVKEVLGGVRFLESSIRPELTEIAGDRVLQFGTYRDVLQSTGRPAEVVVGRFAAVLLRDSTSAWRVSRLIAVADSTVPQRAKPQ
jgi:ketosteroid isomerase-like protein